MSETGLQPDVDSAIDPKEVKQAKEAVQCLVKTLKAYKMYLPNNPIHQKFSGELIQKLSVFLQEYGDLPLQITKSDLLYKGQSVYSDVEKELNLVFRLYADGINSLTIHNGLCKDELFEFLDILKKGLDPENLDDDIVTLLWAKGLEHIHYIASDEFLESDGLKEQQMAQLKGKGIPVSGNFQGAYEDAMSRGSNTDSIQRPLDPASSSVFILKNEEVEELKKQLWAEGNTIENTIEEVFEILVQILYLEKNIEAFSEVVMYLEKGTEALLMRGDLKNASKILGNLWRILEGKEVFSENQILRIKKTIEKMGSEENIRNLKGILNSREIKDPEGLYNYISHLDRRSIPNLCDLLDVNDMQNRRIVCDALTDISKGNIEFLVKRLGDRNWFVVRNIVYILGRTGNKGVVDHLRRTLNHAETRVRRESIRALGMIGTERAKELLLSALEDNDSQNRILGARNLANLNYKRALEPLLKIINRTDFSEKDFSERKAIMEAYGRTGQGEVVSFLRDTLKKKSWFGKSKKDEMRACAAYALGAIGSEEARELLLSEINSNDKVVKKACERALASIGRTTKEEDQLTEAD